MARARIQRFVAVGCVAAAVHWCVVVALVQAAHWRPLVANVGGWLLAFIVSYIGHHRLTFRGHGAPLARSLRRFFVLSAGGFAVNEAAYAVLLGLWVGHDALALAVVLVFVAVLTYHLSRRWAFLRSPASSP